ncbi:uncharacterized protein LOC120631575 [Pararge aegeria]|uniref:uncharacterized protein LOC120631575 n=1 Tax=Pararge aegeria TaxID=116150 RepID=UPI0019D2FF53|nr:uncharacterized protein LOC120631575 [Pararge aegeria]XP_039757147.1 uncharacterized protein LOC120631575 [Pararge aegeria]
MESENRTLARHKHDEENWRRRCGCLRTSDKLKQIIDCFPPPPPPTPEYPKGTSALGNTCISAFCTNVHHCSTLQPPAHNKVVKLIKETHEELEPDKTLKKARTWHVLSELVQLLQISVMATALAFYYLIYCYMQLVYYMLRSALYFHNADGAMKVTIAVVTITSFVVAFNLILKIEKLVGVF